MSFFKKQAGIGLLELMLAMAIIAILLVLSIQYFQSAKNSQLLNAGTEEIQDIIAIVQGMSDPSAYDAENMNKAIILSGSLPEQYYTKGTGNISSPWATSLIVSYDKSADKATITGDDMPNYACNTLAKQFNVAPMSGSCDSPNDATATLTITFPASTGGAMNYRTDSAT